MLSVQNAKKIRKELQKIREDNNGILSSINVTNNPPIDNQFQNTSHVEIRQKLLIMFNIIQNLMGFCDRIQLNSSYVIGDKYSVTGDKTDDKYTLQAITEKGEFLLKLGSSWECLTLQELDNYNKIETALNIVPKEP
jgi:hypothetical protein